MTAEAAERAALGRRWEQATNWPLMAAAVVFLAAYAVPVLDPDLPSWLLDLCQLAELDHLGTSSLSTS